MRLALIALGAALVVAVLTSASIAVRSVSRIWLRHWVERRLAGASLAELYLDRPQRLLVSAGTGIALAVFLAGTAVGAGEPAARDVWWRAVIVGLAIVLFGQLVPRAIARRWPVRLVPILVRALRAIDVFAAPFRQIGALLARPFAARGTRPVVDEARSEIEELLREGAREGVGESEEIAIITGVVQFGEKTAASVMTPRADLFAVDDSLSPQAVAVRIAASKYSRVPVYHGSLDEIVGVVHAFDVLKTSGERWPPLRSVARSRPETPCNELLFTMLRTRRHLAVVSAPPSDGAAHGASHGVTLGVVTLEDLLEELVGDIRDEHDEPDPAPRPTTS